METEEPSKSSFPHTKTQLCIPEFRNLKSHILERSFIIKNVGTTACDEINRTNVIYVFLLLESFDFVDSFYQHVLQTN